VPKYPRLLGTGAEVSQIMTMVPKYQCRNVLDLKCLRSEVSLHWTRPYATYWVTLVLF